MLFLQYYDSTPADYEPEFFHASESDMLKFEQSGLAHMMKVKIGKLQTSSHCMDLAFAGLLDQDLSAPKIDPPSVCKPASHHNGLGRSNEPDDIAESMAAAYLVEKDDDSAATQEEMTTPEKEFSAVREYVYVCRKFTLPLNSTVYNAGHVTEG